MTTLYLTRPGSKVRKVGDAFKVYIPADEDAGDPARKVTLPLHKITQVVVAGNVTLTTPVLQTLLERNVGVTYLTGYGRFLGHLAPPLSKNGHLRIAQHQTHHDPVRRMEMARACVVGKLHNQRVLLMRYHRKLKLDELEDAIHILERCEENAAAVEPDPHSPPDPNHPQAESTWGTLMGYEGTGGAAYFRVFGLLLNDEWTFTKRTRRPPTDPVNALLSFAYTLLYHQTLSAVQTVGLDPYVGFLHGSQYGKPALALDLMEEMRPVIADSVVLTLINKRILSPDDFEEELGAYRLTDAGRRTFYRQWEQRLETQIQHPTFGYTATYRRALILQARLVARWLQEEIPTYPAFIVR
ncbi:MAG: type I-D CRISPR-associated endonuclease Cas1d [Anaerolineae bacterium]